MCVSECMYECVLRDSYQENLVSCSQVVATATTAKSSVTVVRKLGGAREYKETVAKVNH